MTVSQPSFGIAAGVLVVVDDTVAPPSRIGLR